MATTSELENTIAEQAAELRVFKEREHREQLHNRRKAIGKRLSRLDDEWRWHCSQSLNCAVTTTFEQDEEERRNGDRISSESQSLIAERKRIDDILG